MFEKLHIFQSYPGQSLPINNNPMNDIDYGSTGHEDLSSYLTGLSVNRSCRSPDVQSYRYRNIDPYQECNFFSLSLKKQ